MPDEHAHRFWTSATDLPRCSCGKTLLDLYNETEQQLAQAKALLEEWVTEMQVVSDFPGEKGPDYEQALFPRTYAFLGWKESSDGE